MIFPQLFCKHKWLSHQKDIKNERIYCKNIIGDGYNPTGVVKQFAIEVFICEKCGKIKIIKY